MNKSSKYSERDIQIQKGKYHIFCENASVEPWDICV